MTCRTYREATICGPHATREIRRAPKGVRWCFRCRRRTEFFFVVIADVEPSYYDPNPSIRCGACNGSDADLFPGREREWE